MLFWHYGNYVLLKKKILASKFRLPCPLFAKRLYRAPLCSDLQLDPIMSFMYYMSVERDELHVGSEP